MNRNNVGGEELMKPVEAGKGRGAARARVWKFAAAGAVIIILVFVVYAWRSLAPSRLTPTGEYFSQRDKGKLTRDEIMDFNSVRVFMDQPLFNFKGYAEDFPEEKFKYGLAFTAYGLANMAYIDAGYRQAVSHYLDRLIQRMKQKVVWEDWGKHGLGDDPLKEHNIMYKGHLSLMFGLYQWVSGKTTYESEFKALTRNIADEIDNTRYHGVTCEPDDYFVQCNTIGIYSLLLYDRIYGSDHSRQRDNWLKWVKERMVNPDNGVLRQIYHPSHDYAADDASGYGNAWAIAFINAFDPAFARELWDNYKRMYIQTKLGYYAFASERPGGKPDSTATLFALIAAKEMKDTPVFDKLMNAIEKQATPSINGNMVEYKGINKGVQGGLLFAKTNVGLGVILRERPRQ